MIEFRLIAMAFTALTTNATAQELYFHSDVTEGATPSIKITVADKSDPSDGSQSSLTRDMGRCQVQMWVTSDGYVRVTQVTASTGFLALDAACLSAPIGQRMNPSRGADGRPIDQWITIPIIWQAKGSLAAKPANAPDRPDVSIALLAADQSVAIKQRNYPKDALARREQGTCVVHIDLSPSGGVRALSITKSTGSAELDGACRKALRVARFMPAALNRQPVGSSTDVALRWMISD
jgi:TonB family protein